MKKLLIIVVIGLMFLGMCISNKQNSHNNCINKNYSNDYVSFNKESHIYHDLNCDCAQRCTVNCIVITRVEAKNRGGRACHRCNGGNSPIWNELEEENADE